MLKNYEERSIYYCKECNKLYNTCYELDGDNLCARCWSEIKIIPESKIKAFIRNKRLKKLDEISKKNETFENISNINININKLK